MGLTITWAKQQPSSAMWTSDRRLFLTVDDQVVEEDDPAARFLLVAQGGSIPLETAKKYGLATDAEPATEPEGDTAMREAAPETKAVKGPPENKAVTSKETKKGGSKDAEKQHFTPLNPDGDDRGKA